MIFFKSLFCLTKTPKIFGYAQQLQRLVEKSWTIKSKTKFQILWFQLLKCWYVLLSLVFYSSKWIVFVDKIFILAFGIKFWVFWGFLFFFYHLDQTINWIIEKIIDNAVIVCWSPTIRQKIIVSPIVGGFVLQAPGGSSSLLFMWLYSSYLLFYFLIFLYAQIWN